MARMPFATWDPASDGNSTKVCRPNIVCVHTIVGYAPAKAAHFSTRGDGYTWQHRDTERQSAANYLGNGDVIAIENADHGPEFPAWNTNDGHAVPGFSAAQIEAIAKILVFCHRAHGIPLVLVPDTKPGRRGIAYHRMGIDSPNNFAGYAYTGRVSGGVLWTTATGKVCPGDRRITQLINEIIPRARVLAGIDAPPEDDVNLSDKIRAWDGFEITVGQALFDNWQLINNLSDRPTRPDKPADATPWVRQAMSMLTAILAAVTNDPDLTADQIAKIVRDNSVDPAAIAARLLGPLQETLSGMDSVSPEDAEQIAQATARKFAEQLGNNT